LEKVVAEKTGALSPEDSITTAGERMRSMETNTWPVADGRKLVGVLHHANPDREAAGRGHDPKTTLVGESMSRDVPFCYEDQHTDEALRIMLERDMKYLPVVDREMRIVGILSRRELEGSAPTEGESSSDRLKTNG
jgi:CBS-domain-containing membrane protein